jgi:hypothetical protein
MLSLSILVLLVLLLCAAPAGGQTKLLFSFETKEEIQKLQANNTRFETVDTNATQGAKAILVEFLPAEWPNLMVRAEKPWDWRGYGGLAIDIYNPGREPISFGVRVDDDPRADGSVHCRQGGGTIEAGKQATFVLPIGANPMNYGMRGLPITALPNMRSLGSMTPGPLNLDHIIAFQIFLHRPAGNPRLILDNIRLVPWEQSLERIVDEFGQFTRADWPGKLKSADEWKTRIAREEADLKANPDLPEFDRYGGWKQGPQLKASGYFRTEKHNGKWWLVTPEGRLFFSIGMDCVVYSNATFITGREQMFAKLPARDEPLGRYFGHIEAGVHSGPVKKGTTFDFFAANLERKFGRDFANTWYDLALRRLRSWGFNTIGNWSDWRLYRNGRVAYVATAHISGSHSRISSGSDYWGQMHDPFDPQFRVSVASSLKGVTAAVGDDPWCIGYFVDNELSWGGGGEEGGRFGLAYGALAQDSQSPAKRAFINQLKAKYSDISAFNRSWGVNLPSWEAIEAPFRPAGRMTEARRADMAAFVKELARAYFRVVKEELKKAAPNHLYLGCRFAWSTPDAIEASAEYCDVISFNIYAPKVDSNQYKILTTLDRPAIIGEFHFGALDRGMFHTGLVSAESQSERAMMYQAYVHSVLDHPNFVGCHWFQYVDQPLTGRWFDGENYNIGFLTVTDTPYPEVVKAARQVHREAYRRRAGSRTGRRSPSE